MQAKEGFRHCRQRAGCNAPERSALTALQPALGLDIAARLFRHVAGKAVCQAANPGAAKADGLEGLVEAAAERFRPF